MVRGRALRIRIRKKINRHMVKLVLGYRSEFMDAFLLRIDPW